ncbi:MAG: DUF4143 domain-containing protein [Lachnospiraceae bacterium]|nr:DUF4143 domain-containing protein [Lachnospiraceae bacterium]
MPKNTKQKCRKKKNGNAQKRKNALKNPVLRDMLVFAEAHNARILYYADDTGLEADAVYQMENGEYALIEIKTGTNNNE